MQIEIHKPELGQRFMQQIKSGHFQDADELLTKALDALDEKSPASPVSSKAPVQNLVELFEPLPSTEVLTWLKSRTKMFSFSAW